MGKKKILAIAIVVVLVVVGIGLIPASFRIERTAEIQAPPDVVFAILNDLRQTDRWSPFAKLDPNQNVSFSGPESGVGSALTWDGNDQAGAGTMTIEESRPHEWIRMRLDFRRPMPGTNHAFFELSPVHKGAGTLVNWGMEGRTNLFGKGLCTMVGMYRTIESLFDEGLQALNQVAQEDWKQRMAEATAP